MHKKIKIVKFYTAGNSKPDIQAAERELENLINDGWLIVTGGGTGDGW